MSSNRNGFFSDNEAILIQGLLFFIVFFTLISKSLSRNRMNNRQERNFYSVDNNIEKEENFFSRNP